MINSFFSSTILALLATFIALASGLPDCGGGYHNNKANSSTPYQGCYEEGQGSFVGAVNVSYPYSFPLIRKCWEELYVVTASETFTPWQQVSGLK
jgi:hypothetical protein